MNLVCFIRHSGEMLLLFKGDFIFKCLALLKITTSSQSVNDMIAPNLTEVANKRNIG